jgi:hypothetical protein
LGDHRYLTAPDFAHLFLALFEEIITFQKNTPTDDLTGRFRHEPQNGETCHTFTASGLSHQTQAFSMAEVEADAIYRFG